MKVPIQITFHDIAPSEAVEAKIRERLDALDQFSPHIVRCEVWIDAPHRHRRKGRRYTVRIRVTAHQGELRVDRQPAQDDIYIAIRDAFDAIRRQLEDYERRYRGDVKAHEQPPRAQVLRLFPAEGYGFLRTPEGREIYFHRNSVRDVAFDELCVGTPVSFAEEAGLDGPQATVVRVLEGAPVPAP
jgi:ribosomal subunit interface protein